MSRPNRPANQRKAQANLPTQVLKVSDTLPHVPVNLDLRVGHIREPCATLGPGSKIAADTLTQKDWILVRGKSQRESMERRRN